MERTVVMVVMVVQVGVDRHLQVMVAIQLAGKVLQAVMLIQEFIIILVEGEGEAAILRAHALTLTHPTH